VVGGGGGGGLPVRSVMLKGWKGLQSGVEGGAWVRSLPSWLPLTSGYLTGAVSCVVVAFLVLQGVSAFRRPAECRACGIRVSLKLDDVVVLTAS